MRSAIDLLQKRNLVANVWGLLLIYVVKNCLKTTLKIIIIKKRSQQIEGIPIMSLICYVYETVRVWTLTKIDVGIACNRPLEYIGRMTARFSLFQCENIEDYNAFSCI